MILKIFLGFFMGILGLLLGILGIPAGASRDL